MPPTDRFPPLAGLVRRLAPRRGGSALFVAAVLALAGVRAYGLAVVQMPFNGWDELPHLAVAYAVHKTGRMPTPRTPMPRELIPFITAHPHPTASLSMLRGIEARPYPGGAAACGVEPAKRFDMFLYQAQHGPLFYHLMALACPGPDPARLLAWADAGRLLNAGLLLGTLALWRFVLGRLVPDQGPLAWLPDGALLLCASFSYLFYDCVRFSNDALALFLGSLALALHVLWKADSGRTGPRLAWRGLVLGGAAGLAVLAKATCLPLAGVLGIMLLWPCLRPGTPGRDRLAALAGLAAFAVGYAAVAGTYHLDCLLRYGQLTGMQEAVFSARRGFGLRQLLGAAPHLGYGWLRNPLFYNGMPHVAGWSNLGPPSWLNTAFRTAIAGCVLALAVALARREGRRQLRRFLAQGPELPALLGLCTLALLFHALHATLAWGFPTTGPWYAMPALPALFLLLLLGPALLGQRAGVTALVFLAVVCNAAYLGGTWDTLLAQETGITDFSTALGTVAAHHALALPDLTFLPAADLALLAVALAWCASHIPIRQAACRPATPRLLPRPERRDHPAPLRPVPARNAAAPGPGMPVPLRERFPSRPRRCGM